MGKRFWVCFRVLEKEEGGNLSFSPVILFLDANLSVNLLQVFEALQHLSAGITRSIVILFAENTATVSFKINDTTTAFHA